MAHQYMRKILHDPHKPSGPPPTYLMYGLLHIQGVHNLILLAFFFIIFVIR